MEMTLWVNKNKINQFQDLVKNHNLRFKNNPFPLGERFLVDITGEVENFNNFNIDFDKLKQFI